MKSGREGAENTLHTSVKLSRTKLLNKNVWKIQQSRRESIPISTYFLNIQLLKYDLVIYIKAIHICMTRPQILQNPYNTVTKQIISFEDLFFSIMCICVCWGCKFEYRANGKPGEGVGYL